MSIQRSIYFKGSSDSPFSLKKSAHTFIIKTKPTKNAAHILETAIGTILFKQNIKLISRFDDSDATVFKLINTDLKLQELKERVRSKFEKDIEYIGSTLEYQNSTAYNIYTGNIYLEFEDVCTQKFCLDFLKSNKLQNKTKLNFGDTCFFVQPETSLGIEIFEFCERLLKLPEVKCCHPELVTELRAQKSHEVIYNSKVDNTFLQALKDDWWMEQASIRKAWETTQGENTIIAVIDDGIELDHQAFHGKIRHPIDMKTADKNGEPRHNTYDKHGTPVASVACSSDPEAMGVAPNAALIPIRITGLGSVLQSEAICWAVDKGADIISCSWGPPDGDIFDDTDNEYFHPLPDHTRKAFEYAAKYGRNGKGCVIVFAAGNGNEPARFDGYISAKEVIAVTSSNYKNERSRFADYGRPVACSFPSGDFYLNTKNEIVFRSGVRVADRLNEPGYSEGDYFSFFTGTSASCPGAAGVFSLMLSANPHLTAEQIKNSIPKICDKIGDSQYDSSGYSNDYGYGRLNAEKAVRYALNNNNLNTPNTMKNAISLHIGINDVSESYYPEGSVPPLYGCINDMKKMEALADSLDYATNTLQNDEATKSNIIKQIIDLGNSVTTGGILLVSYSGHGVQLSDNTNNESNLKGDEEDGRDESWVTYDGILLDDEIYNALAAIKNEIRVLFISDSCHSETMTKFVDLSGMTGFIQTNDNEEIERGISRRAAQKILKKNGSSIEELLSQSPKRTQDPKAIVINLSACQGDQTAKEIDGIGVFTEALIDVYTDKSQSGDEINYIDFIAEIREKVNSRVAYQDPNYSTSHRSSDAFLYQFPFDTSAISTSTPIDDSKPDNVKPKPYEPMNPTSDKPDIVLNTNELMVDYGNNDVQSVPSANERSTNKQIWDSAYEFVLNNDEAKYVEPNLMSNLYYEGQTHERGKKIVGSAEYLETYPPFLGKGQEVDFIWHLREEYSGLELARNEVFPELELGQTSYEKDVVKIAHIDTGVLKNHPTRPINQQGDGIIIKGTKAEEGAIDKNKKFYPAEQDGHGQATISILAGNQVGWEHTENRFNGFFGANPYAKVLPIKISDSVVLLSGRRFAEAIDEAIKHKCDVVTMSMAGLPSKTMAKAIDRAYKAGIVVVSAASNCWSKNIFKRMAPKKTLYPARYDRVIAAVGCTYTKRPYLNRYNTRKTKAAGGLYMQSCYGPAKVMPTTIAAYTPNISWFNKVEKGLNGELVYYEKGGGGTSSATPQVAAAASLYIQKYKQELSKYQGDNAWKKVEIVREALFRSADKDSEFVDDYFGNGILKANKALAPEFAPQKMLPHISESSEARKVKNFWAKFKIWGNRSLSSKLNDDKKVIIGDMIMEEIQQLVHLDESLYNYQDIDFDSGNVDILEFPELVNGLKGSSLSSQFLKNVLNQIDTNKSKKSYKTIAEVSKDFGNVNITSNNTQFSILNSKSYKDGYGLDAVYIDEFEIIVNDTERSFSNKNAGIVLNIEAGDLSLGEDEDLYSTLLVETVYGEDSIVELQVQQNARKTSTRSTQEVFPIESNTYVLYSNHSYDRGITSFAKRFIVKTIKWVGKKVLKNVIKKLPKKTADRKKTIFNLAEKFGDSRYEIMVYDLNKLETNTKSGWRNIDSFDKDIFEEIKNDTKEALLLFPGLFSTVESSFDEFLVGSVIETLKLKYARYVLGFNVPSVFHGIEKNANEINKLIVKKISNKSCTALCHSRGGVVARHLFEINWINNNTLSPTKDAPFVLTKLIMAGTPNQGTKMASSENWNSLFNSVLNVTKFTLGTFVPVIPMILSAVKAIGVGLTELPGINDLEESSDLLKKLNTTKSDRSKYYVYITNFEPRKGWLKKLFDERIIDRKIFDREKNDMVVPLLGGIFLDQDQDNIVVLSKDQYEVINETNGVSHFRYLNIRKQKQLVETIVAKL